MLVQNGTGKYVLIGKNNNKITPKGENKIQMNNKTSDNPNPKKINLFLDADDTILKSSDAVIDIINKKYNINPPKTYKDMTDWKYQSICPKVTSEEVKNIFSSDDFFDMVKFDENFVDFYTRYRDKFNFIIVTKGDKENLRKKENKIAELMGGNFKFIGLDFYNGYNKSVVNMDGGIQVDDRTDSLEDTNAKIKILINHGRNFRWNSTAANVGNLYVVKDWNESEQVIETCVKYPEVMMR